MAAGQPAQQLGRDLRGQARPAHAQPDRLRKLTAWLEANGKTLVCLDPQLDLTTPSGRAFAQVLVTFAEYERETIAARVRDAWHKLGTAASTPGQVPFGYRPVKLDKGWGYEPDPGYGPVVAEMYDRYVRYESLGSIARWLNETGVLTPGT